MEKRIELEKRGQTCDQIKELNLDNCRSPTIVGLDDSFVNLESLSMINSGLVSLKGFPNLPNLKRLELSDNKISNGLNHLKGSPNLEYLNLCGNKIKDFETLEPLKELKKLEILDLFNCEVTEIPDYRKKEEEESEEFNPDEEDEEDDDIYDEEDEEGEDQLKGQKRKQTEDGDEVVDGKNKKVQLNDSSKSKSDESMENKEDDLAVPAE
ncbi:acidic leucine-rich nuclear phosphoprotein 32 family member A-like protein [Sarcoptes scabiei]|uniref:Acidic leucine-rich nuclear phosphoprotein 32 family member A-like protein n=1 Tax=Sarcoptes scabiei TaxID=52283 RepID=A0A131ZVP3_SARSC|nr:acidic leucine-rich nuclear phosphoprotein 32 family member A-like protein [Sarcoptes scabiei]